MIDLESVTAQARRLGGVHGVTARWSAGVHAICGPPSAGTYLLLALVAGVARVKSGRVEVLGSSPRKAAIKRQLAWIPLAAALPQAMRVGEALDLAARLRTTPRAGAEVRLSVLGLGALAPRLLRSLSQAEVRAVALVEAITSPAVRVLLIEEPLLLLEPRALVCLPRALRAAADAGKAVLIATASLRDAAELAESHSILKRGVPAASPETFDAHIDTPDASLRLVLRGPAEARALVAALERAGSVPRMMREAHVVRLGGSQGPTLARAAAHAVLEARVSVVEMRVDDRAVAPPGAP